MKRLFIDIETAPYNAYVWRCGKQFVSNDSLRYLPRDGNIICACWKWEGKKKVHSLQWDDTGDKQLIKDLMPVLLDADEIVAQNGDRFDIPYLNMRNLAHRMEPLPIWKTVDTLVIARKRFKFPSNRLDAMGKFLLGEGKIRTDFEWWKEIKENNSQKHMALMVKYCKKDVVLLESVYTLLAGYHRAKSHVGVVNGRDKWTCSHCGSKSVRRDAKRHTAAGTLQHQMRCKDCHKYTTISNRVYEEWLEWLQEFKNAKAY